MLEDQETATQIGWENQPNTLLVFTERMKLSRAWLTERITQEQILVEHDLGSSDSHFGADWERLLANKVAGDELWRFAPPPGEIEVTGIALVRNGEVIATLVEAVY